MVKQPQVTIRKEGQLFKHVYDVKVDGIKVGEIGAYENEVTVPVDPGPHQICVKGYIVGTEAQIGGPPYTSSQIVEVDLSDSEHRYFSVLWDRGSPINPITTVLLVTLLVYVFKPVCHLSQSECNIICGSLVVTALLIAYLISGSRGPGSVLQLREINKPT